MNIVIPMAGRGSRFVDAGFDVPKPLIEVLGRPLYSLAVDCLPLHLADPLIFVCLKDHLDHWRLGDDIAERYARFNPQIVVLDVLTDGQLCSVLEASEHFHSGGVLIYNADTVAHSNLEATLSEAPDADGAIGVFRAPGDHWSFARRNARGDVVETAEKRRISPWATTGLYHFADTERFIRLAQGRIARGNRDGNEFYVAPLYNDLLADGGRVVADEAIGVEPIGTPIELKAYLGRHASR